MADNFLKGLLGAASDDQFRADLKNGLFDLGKGASRSAGQMVTGGVDLMSLLLSPLGYNHPAPVGSTAWAEQKGMIPKAEYTNRLAGLLGEGLGGVAPMVAQAKAPQIANGLLTLGENASKPNLVNGPSRNQAGAIVWHGSPHKFDKFDSSKIGTGEGAQAYGHGLYLAESPDVAKSYQSALSADRGFSFGGKTGLTRSEVQDIVNAKYGAGYLDGVIRPSGVADSFIDDIVTGTVRAQGAYPRQYKPGSERAKIYDELRGQITHADPGSLYKVDLPDTAIARMLDWDKPLSQQAPDVQLALETIRERAAKSMPAIANGDPAGRGIYAAYQAHRGGNQSAVSERLRELGIPGIRYLDGGSRGAGAGSSNFVVFPGNEDMLKIIERNGQPVNALKGLLNP